MTPKKHKTIATESVVRAIAIFAEMKKDPIKYLSDFAILYHSATLASYSAHDAFVEAFPEVPSWQWERMRMIGTRVLIKCPRKHQQSIMNDPIGHLLGICELILDQLKA